MTISSTTRVAGPFTGTGTVSTFPFTFKVFEPTDVYATTLEVAAATTATLALTTDYTVALNADQDTSPGGSITLVPTGQAGAVLATGYQLTITTDMAELQMDPARGHSRGPLTLAHAAVAGWLAGIPL